MGFQRNMWAEAWVQSIAAYKLVILGIAGELMLEQSMEWFEDAMPPSLVLVWTLASTCVWCFLAYAVHAQILSARDRGSVEYSVRAFGFALRTIAIFVVVWGTMFGMAYTLSWMPAAREFLDGYAQVPLLGEVHLLMVWLLLIPLMVGLPLFVCVATMLPAYVADQAGGLVAAFRRGKSQFSWIAGRLLIGPFLLTAFLIMISVLPAIDAGRFGFLWSDKGALQFVAGLWSLVYYAVTGFGVSLTAVILSRAFLRAEGMPETAAA